nr:MAG TPA: hypothetical protein [Caudoviricetes sp.]
MRAVSASSRSRVACWYRRATSTSEWPPLWRSSAKVAPCCAKIVRPVCLRSWYLNQGMPAAWRAV